jgi:hypothetical protein
VQCDPDVKPEFDPHRQEAKQESEEEEEELLTEEEEELEEQLEHMSDGELQEIAAELAEEEEEENRPDVSTLDYWRDRYDYSSMVGEMSASDEDEGEEGWTDEDEGEEGETDEDEGEEGEMLEQGEEGEQLAELEEGALSGDEEWLSGDEEWLSGEEWNESESDESEYDSESEDDDEAAMWDVNHSSTMEFMQRRMMSAANKPDVINDLFRAPPEWEGAETNTIEELLDSIKPYLVAPSVNSLREQPTRMLHHLTDVPPQPPSQLGARAAEQALLPDTDHTATAAAAASASSDSLSSGEEDHAPRYPDFPEYEKLSPPCPEIEQPEGMDDEEYEDLVHEVRMEYGIELLSEYNISTVCAAPLELASIVLLPSHVWCG